MSRFQPTFPGREFRVSGDFVVEKIGQLLCRTFYLEGAALTTN